MYTYSAILLLVTKEYTLPPMRTVRGTNGLLGSSLSPRYNGKIN